MFGVVTGLQQRQNRQNRFEILERIKNSGDGFHQPPCTTMGVWLHARPRVKTINIKTAYD